MWDKQFGAIMPFQPRCYAPPLSPSPRPPQAPPPSTHFTEPGDHRLKPVEKWAFPLLKLIFSGILPHWQKAAESRVTKLKVPGGRDCVLMVKAANSILATLWTWTYHYKKDSAQFPLQFQRELFFFRESGCKIILEYTSFGPKVLTSCHKCC